MKTANPPLGRLQWVLKTYEKRPRVVERTFDIASRLFGLSQDPPHRSKAGSRAWLERHANLLGHPTSYDFIVPWIAVQFASIDRKIEKGTMVEEAMDVLSCLLEEWVAQIAAWARHEKVELTKWSLTDVIGEVEGWNPPAPKIDRGEVVYKFEDGWTIQRLVTAEHLRQEGDAMQHCVGQGNHCAYSYLLLQPEKGSIFSLRDKNNAPHVTIETDPIGIVAMRGKQNAGPVSEYIRKLKNAPPGLLPGLHQYLMRHDR